MCLSLSKVSLHMNHRQDSEIQNADVDNNLIAVFRELYFCCVYRSVETLLKAFFVGPFYRPITWTKKDVVVFE